MRNKIFPLLAILIEVASLYGCCGVAHSATPMIAAGSSHSAILKNDGTVVTAGDDGKGQLGQGRNLSSTLPTSVPGLPPVRNVVGGYRHTVALSLDGMVWTWGNNQYGQLGDGSTTNRSTPVKVKNLTNIIAISAGDNNTFALQQDGTVWSWGDNFFGKLGDGTDINRSNPVRVESITNVIAISAGYNHTLALRQDGTVWVWGSNYLDSYGTETTESSAIPVQVTGLSSVSAISAGVNQSIVLKKDGTAWAWGNGYGQTPVQGANLTNVSAVAAGNGLFALKQDGTLWQWSNGYTAPMQPQPIANINNVIAISAGVSHFLLLKQDGTLWAWGSNNYGQLGSGNSTYSPTAVQVAYISSIGAIAVGGDFPTGTSIVLKKDGTVWSWGYNGDGQLGDGVATSSNIPLPVPNLANIRSVSSGGSHTVALKQDGTVWAWGDNHQGQLGDDSAANRSTPVQVVNLTDVRAVAAGDFHTVALKSDGTVWAWGSNGYGQLGDGNSGLSNIPVQVANLVNVISIAAGQMFSLALKQDGTVWAWGHNAPYGQLGDGTATDRRVPVEVANLTDVAAIAAGDWHAAAVKRDGSVWTWGLNNYGQLGDGTSIDRSTPVQVVNLTSVVAVAAGGDGAWVSHTLALKQDGTVWTWGSNRDGQLGSGSTNHRITPAPIPNLSSVNSISAGSYHSAALRQDGTVWAWGNNWAGQLGDATYAFRLAPAMVANLTATGPLDLIPEVANNIPPELIPPYWLKVTKAAEVSSAVTYNPEDLNKDGSVYVVAYLPTNSPLLSGTTSASAQIARIAKDTGCPVSTAGTVPAVLTRGGWKQTDCTTPTLPLYTGTLNTDNNTFGMYDASLFDQTKDNGLFCVAYAGASTTSAKGLIRSVVSGVDANLNICPPIQIGSGTSDTTAPSIPLNLTATAAGPGQVNLNWNAATDNTGVTRYNIYRGTTQIAILENVTSYTDSSPLASTAYSYSVMACDAAANCSGQSTPAQTSTPAQPSVTLGAGWNLVGNGGTTAMNVPSLFGDASKIYSLWKWVKAGSTPNIAYPNWAFYTPSQTDSGAAYAASKGYDTFSSIASGEGFWVNVKVPVSVPMTAPAWILSSIFAPNQSKALTPGWSLIATGEAQTASAFNKAMSPTPPAPGTIPINLTSLWAWQNSAQRWYFYAPSLEANSGLNAYLNEMNYLDFGSVSFAPTMGFWVNK